MYLSCVYSSTPCREPSRPKPECLNPPKGIGAPVICTALTPTIPYSSASAQRWARARGAGHLHGVPPPHPICEGGGAAVGAGQVAGENIGDEAVVGVVGSRDH